MYEFEKLPNEEIVIISDDSLLKVDQDNIPISTIITKKRMLLLDYPKKSNDFNEVMRIAKGMDYIRKKEVLLAVLLTEISKIEKDEDYDKYILNNGNYFYLKDDTIKQYFN